MDIFCREVKPVAPPSPSEIRFWLRIMKEHALFIKQGLPDDKPELQAEAQKFHDTFANLEQRVQHLYEKDYPYFADMAMVAVKRIFAFKRHLLHLLIECRLPGSGLYPLTIDHTSREAMYFIKLLGKIQYGDDQQHSVDTIVNENVFWLRIMADHLAMIRGFVDPADRLIFEQVNILSRKYDELSLQARDFASLLWRYCPTNEFVHFEKNVAKTTSSMRDFLAAAERMFKEGAALAVTPPLLADHICRETEHFLHVLEIIRQDLMNIVSPSISDSDK